MFSTPLIIFYAICYGLTMKIADLLNEHGLKWFKGSALLFGILWGAFGALLVMSSNEVANIILAMNVAFITRGRLDRINHQVATTMIIIGFLYISTFNPLLFFVFYLIFLIFGSLEDYADVFRKKHLSFAFLNETMWYYPVSTFVYCLKYGHWIIFGAILSFMICYDLTKYVASKCGYK